MHRPCLAPASGELLGGISQPWSAGEPNKPNYINQITKKGRVGTALQVTLREGETQESLLTRFTKMIQRSGLLKELKQKRHYISPGEKMRAARRKAIRRARKAAAKQKAQQ